MAHLPINHRLAGFYRFLAALSGLYLLAFGIVGVVRTRGEDLFMMRGITESMGLRTNLAFSILSIVVGAIVFLSTLIRWNFGHFVLYAGGVIFWVAGVAGLLVMQTDANILNFQVSTAVVSFIIGTVLVLSGLYGKRGTAIEAQAEEAFRHSGRNPAATAHLPTPGHAFSAHPSVKHQQK
jgi:low affinity Fe/Cu permease